jgi:hypothetical protein
VLARLLAVFVAGSIAYNVLLLVVIERSGLAARPIDVQTRGLYEERLRRLESTAVLGDSLVFGGHLAEKHGSAWPAMALPGQLAQQLPGKPRVLNLGINGLLFRELSCVLDDVLARRPALVFVNVSPRPFAEDFAAEADPTRSFVCAPPGSVERALHSLPALRLRDLWQFGVLGNTPRMFVRNLFAPPAPAASARAKDDEDDDAFVAAQLWRFRAANRLNSIDVSAEHPQAVYLDHLLAASRKAVGTQLVLFYLHEDETALDGQLQVERFHAQRARFTAWLERGLAGATHARFVELPSADFRREYVDHVHLTARGYRMLAQRLIDKDQGRAATH